jgi:hypothetical protein
MASGRDDEAIVVGARIPGAGAPILRPSSAQKSFAIPRSKLGSLHEQERHSLNVHSQGLRHDEMSIAAGKVTPKLWTVEDDENLLT